MDERPLMLQKLLGPIIDQVLNRLDLDKRLDELRDRAFQEIEETRTKAFQELEEARDKTLAMLAGEMPKMAAAISQAAVETVFEHTHVDEATDKVSNVFIDILNRLPFGIGQQR